MFFCFDSNVFIFSLKCNFGDVLHLDYNFCLTFFRILYDALVLYSNCTFMARISRQSNLETVFIVTQTQSVDISSGQIKMFRVIFFRVCSFSKRVKYIDSVALEGWFCDLWTMRVAKNVWYISNCHKTLLLWHMQVLSFWHLFEICRRF